MKVQVCVVLALVITSSIFERSAFALECVDFTGTYEEPGSLDQLDITQMGCEKVEIKYQDKDGKYLGYDNIYYSGSGHSENLRSQDGNYFEANTWSLKHDGLVARRDTFEKNTSNGTIFTSGFVETIFKNNDGSLSFVSQSWGGWTPEMQTYDLKKVK